MEARYRVRTAGQARQWHPAGLLRRSKIAWWWSRYVAALFGTISAIPLAFGAACIVFHLLGGTIPDEMGFLVRVLLIAGVFSLIPSTMFWTIYFSLNTTQAREYCRVCPDCSNRFKAPIQFLFCKMKCEHCRCGTENKAKPLG